MLSPVEITQTLVMCNGNTVAINQQSANIMRNFRGKASMRTIVFSQVCNSGQFRRLVDCNNFHLLTMTRLIQRPQQTAPNPAIAVNR